MSLPHVTHDVRHPKTWELSGTTVMDAFNLLALLKSKMRTGGPSACLVVPHHGLHENRLDGAMEERNLEMTGTGQPQWGHTCQICMKFYKGEDGNFCTHVSRFHSRQKI